MSTDTMPIDNTTLPVETPQQADPLAMMLADNDRLAALPIDTLERLIALRERDMAKTAKQEFFRDLAEFQRRCPIIEKQRGVGTSKSTLYRYAPLPHIVEVIEPIERELGFVHRWNQRLSEDGSGVLVVSCIISHRGGHSETTDYPVAPTVGQNTNAAQNLGIMAMYGRRNSLVSGYGIVTADPDTDGNYRPAPDTNEKISAEQVLTISAMLDELPAGRKTGFWKWASTVVGDEINVPESIPGAYYDQLFGKLDNARRS